MKRIICHGDSLTEGADIEAAYRWPTLLQTLSGFEVFNTGIGGDTTTGMLCRFPADVVARKPDAVIIMGGTNDFWWNLPVNVAIANLFTMAYQAQYHGIAPILGLPMSFDVDMAAKQPYAPPEAGYDRLLEKVKALVSKIESGALENDIPTLDFHRPFMDEIGHVRSEYFLPDGVHPNRKGHKRIADLIASKLKEFI